MNSSRNSGHRRQLCAGGTGSRASSVDSSASCDADEALLQQVLYAELQPSSPNHTAAPDDTSQPPSSRSPHQTRLSLLKRHANRVQHTAEEFSNSPLRTSATPRLASREESTFGEEDNNLLLRALVNSLAQPAAFRSTRGNDTSGTAAAAKPALSGGGTSDVHRGPTSLVGGAPPTALGPATATRTSPQSARHSPAFHRSSSGDSAVLSAIAEAEERQQSSVSGSLFDDEQLRVEAAVPCALRRAEAIASSRPVVRHHNRADCILRFHEHVILGLDLHARRALFGAVVCVALAPQAASAALTACLGTTTGHLLLVNDRWSLCGECTVERSTAGRASGAITSLSISHDAATIAAGYAAGNVILWSARTLQPVRMLTSEFAAAIAVVQLLPRSIDNFVVLDHVGTLKLFYSTTIITKAVNRHVTFANASPASPYCHVDILPQPTRVGVERSDGAAAAVRTGDSPALARQHASGRAVGDERRCLVATASAAAVHLFVADLNLQSSVRSVAQRSYSGRGTTSTSALVRFVLFGPPQPRVVLALSHGAEFDLLHVCFDSRGSVEGLVGLSALRVSCPLRSMVVAAGENIVALDHDDHLLLLDPVAGVVAERYALTRADSPAGRAMLRDDGGTLSCVLATDQSNVCVVGPAQVTSCALLTWQERLEALEKGGKLGEAMELMRSLHDEVALCAVGVNESAAQHRRHFAYFVERLGIAYLVDALGSGAARKVLEKYITFVIEFCNAVGALDAFWGPIMRFLERQKLAKSVWYAVEACIVAGTVIELPEAHLMAFCSLFVRESVADKIAAPVRHDCAPDEEFAGDAQVTDSVSHAPRNHTTEVGGSARCERALMHLTGNLDALMALADRLHFLRLQVFIISHRRGEYVKALQHSLAHERPQRAVCKPPRYEPVSSSVSVDYLVALMHDRTLLPHVGLPAGTRAAIKTSLWRYLLQDVGALRDLVYLDPRRVGEAAFAFLRDGAWGTESERAPALRTQCLAQLFCVLTESASKPPARVSRPVFPLESDDHEGGAAPPQPALALQTCAAFNPLVLARRPWPPYSTLHDFIQALAAVVFVDDGLPMSSAESDAYATVILEDYVYVFTACNDPHARRRLQEDLVPFLASPKTSDAILSLYVLAFEEKCMARCLAVLYCRRGDYAKAIDTYLEPKNNLVEANLAHAVFTFLKDAMARLQSCDSPRRTRLRFAGERERRMDTLRRAVVERVTELVGVDAAMFASFVREVLPLDRDDVLNVLRGSSRAFYQYLDELFSTSTGGSSHDDRSLHNSYIELMCAYEPSRVYPYLHDREAEVAYDVQLALRAVRRHKVVDAAIFLLDKIFMTKRAMALVVSAVRESLQELRAAQIALEGDDELPRAPSSRLTRSNTQVFDGADVAHEKDRETRASCVSLTSRDGDRLPTPRNSLSMRSRDCDDHTAAQTYQQAAKKLDRFVQLGVTICSRHHRDRHPSTQFWFQLVEVFSRPRRMLAERLAADRALRRPFGVACREARVECAEVNRAEGPLEPLADVQQHAEADDAEALHASHAEDDYALSSLSFRVATAMEEVYSRYMSELLRSMISVLDPSTVAERIVVDHANDAFELYQPIMAEVFASLRFDVEASQLLGTCLGDDGLAMGLELARRARRGVAPLSSTCGACQTSFFSSALTPQSPSAQSRRGPPAGSGEEAACLFSCGHGYHELCLRRATQTMPGCPQCERERFGLPAEAVARLHEDLSVVREGDARTTEGDLVCRRVQRTRAGVARCAADNKALKTFLAPSADPSPPTFLLAFMRDGGCSSYLHRGAGREFSSTSSVESAVAEGSEDAAILNALTDADIIELFGDR